MVLAIRNVPGKMLDIQYYDWEQCTEMTHLKSLILI